MPHSWLDPSAQAARTPTFSFQDHHVAELALSLFVEALHLDVVGGLRLEVGDGMPVPVTLHHVLLVVAVIVAVRRAVVNVEPVDGRVVHRSVLSKKEGDVVTSPSPTHAGSGAHSRPPTVHLRMTLVSLMASL